MPTRLLLFGPRLTPMTRGEAEEPRMRRRTFAALARAGEVLLAREGARIAGVVAFYMAGARSGMIASAGEAELSRLAIAEPFKRRGIGRKLVEGCLQLAADRHASALVLWSRPHQVEAHQLYLSLNFHRAPDRDGEDADGSSLVFIHRL